MLTPEQLEALPYPLIKHYRNLEDYILKDVSRRIAKAGTITDTAEWQIIRLKELGEANDVIKNKIAEISKLSKKEIDSLFFDSAQMSTDFYKSVYEKAGKEFIPLYQNESLLQLLNAGIKQTNKDLYNFTQSMGFATIEGGKTVFKPIAKVYQDTLDFTQMQVSSGAVDYITAIKQATNKLADSGIRFIDYKTGWVNRADVAVRRAVLTGVGQVTGKVSEQAMDDLDTDIVEVTAHAGARPEHAKWQGKWYSFSGKSDKYPSLVTVTHYGEGDGLKGWNCRHDYFPVVPGISERAYSDEDLKKLDNEPFEYDGKTYTHYEATQYQRKIETSMRKTKRELIAADGSGNKAEFTAKSIKLNRQKELYNNFSKKAGLLKQNERLRELNFDRSKAQKASNIARHINSHNSNIGITTSNGIKITSVSKHFGERAVERNISPKDVQNALTSPLKKGKIRADRTQQFIGEKATIAINVDTGKLTTVWQTSSKKAENLKGGH